MPTYVYNCESCDQMFEENIKYEDRDAPIEHPCKISGGKIRDSKGRVFKPKRITGKSLLERVMSKDFGRVKKK